LKKSTENGKLVLGKKECDGSLQGSRSLIRKPEKRERIMKKIPVMVLAAMIMTLPAFAQSDDEQTIEQLYLQNSVQSQIIRAEAYSNDQDMKMIAISDIEAMVEDGKVAQDDPVILQVLFDLGQEGVSRQVREQGHVINDFPMVRKEACRLLGQVGGPQARQFLSNILLTDPEPMVMSEAIVALAKCGSDDTGRTQRVMAASMYRQTATKRDNNFAVAFLNSVEIMFKNGDEIRDPFLFEEIIKIADPSSGYRTIVQKRAIALLKLLQGQDTESDG
jgi:hypothetical protein